MKSETRRERMARLMAEGEDDELFDLLPKVEPEKDQEELNDEQQRSRDAEALLTFLRDPNLFVRRECKKCHGEFYTDYGSVSYCKDFCRIAALKDYGIVTWDFKKPLHSRWGNPIPLIVGPDTLQFLRQSLLQTTDLSVQGQQMSDA